MEIFLLIIACDIKDVVSSKKLKHKRLFASKLSKLCFPLFVSKKFVTQGVQGTGYFVVYFYRIPANVYRDENLVKYCFLFLACFGKEIINNL